MASIRIQKYRWLLELGFLVMLAALALTVRRDSMGLRASEHKTAASGPIAVTASFETKDWPRNLRTDLRGATITVALPMVQALERSHRWIGALSPPDVVRHLEDDSLRIWKNGDAAFMRNWPYAYLESMQPESSIRNRIGVTLRPSEDGPNARHADVLGGFQLMVSKQSSHKDAAIELLKFLTSPEIQGVNAATRGYAPTRPALYDSWTLKSNPFYAIFRDVLVRGAVTRPSTIAGPEYDRLSTFYFTAVRQTLNGKKSAAVSVAELEKELHRLGPNSVSNRRIKAVPAGN